MITTMGTIDDAPAVLCFHCNNSRPAHPWKDCWGFCHPVNHHTPEDLLGDEGICWRCCSRAVFIRDGEYGDLGLCVECTLWLQLYEGPTPDALDWDDHVERLNAHLELQARFEEDLYLGLIFSGSGVAIVSFSTADFPEVLAVMRDRCADLRERSDLTPHDGPHVCALDEEHEGDHRCTCWTYW